MLAADWLTGQWAVMAAVFQPEMLSLFVLLVSTVFIRLVLI